MTDRPVPRINRLPFYIADFVLIVVAWWIMSKSPHPLAAAPLSLIVVCVALAMAFALVPNVLEYQAMVKESEASRLADTVTHIGKVEAAAEQIRLATSLWQGVQEQSGKTAAAAKEIATRMTEEAKAFADFMQKANDTEKGTLRLEVEKLRRAEGDWLQVLVRLMDHVFALHRAAMRSGQRNVIDQLGHFQNACRDVTRRIGLAPIEVPPGQPFDAKQHELLKEAGPPPADAIVAETLAPGYTFQGRLLRLPLVALKTKEVSAEGTTDRAEPASGQEELGLGVAAEDETPAGLS